MKTIAIIPWRDNKERRSNLNWIKSYLENLCDEVIVSEDNSGSDFSRAKAFNDGIDNIELSEDVVVVLCDSDCFVTVHAFKKAVRVAKRTGWLVIPFDSFCQTTPKQKDWIIKNLDPKIGPRGTLFRESRSGIKPSGGIGMVRADRLKEVRFDERFIGWGSEDVAFFFLMNKRFGHKRLDGPLFHLHHPVADKSNRVNNRNLLIDSYKETEIPRVLNFVWVGGEMPESQRANIETWKKHNPNWEIRIWGNDDVPWFKCQEAIKSQPTLAGVSDVMRIEIIYRLGGVYVDTDMECFRSIDTITKNTRSFIVRETEKYICNSVFGAAPESRTLRPIFECFRDMQFPTKGGQNQTTGPHLFTKLANTSVAKILEPKSFFPIPYSKRNELGRSDIDLTDKDIYAHHQWAGTWKNPSQ